MHLSFFSFYKNLVLHLNNITVLRKFDILFPSYLKVKAHTSVVLRTKYYKKKFIIVNIRVIISNKLIQLTKSKKESEMMVLR